MTQLASNPPCLQRQRRCLKRERTSRIKRAEIVAPKARCLDRNQVALLPQTPQLHHKNIFGVEFWTVGANPSVSQMCERVPLPKHFSHKPADAEHWPTCKNTQVLINLPQDHRFQLFRLFREQQLCVKFHSR